MATRRVTALGLTVAVATLLANSAGLANNGLTILFWGVKEVHGAPVAATATLTAAGIENIRRLPLRNGAELSPSGKYIAFDTCDPNERGIVVSTVDYSQRRMVVSAIDGELCVAVRWSKDERQISYAGAHDYMLHIVDLSTGLNTPLPNTFFAPGWHSWSRHGDGIAYESGRGGRRRIDVVDLRTGETRTLVGAQEFGSCEVWAPDWSPTADRIVFTNCESMLFVVDGDGRNLAALATDAYAPRWAPDGRSVFFLGAGASGRLRRIAMDGSGATETIGRLPVFGGPFSLAAAGPDD